jgi:hypothetical protein
MLLRAKLSQPSNQPASRLPPAMPASTASLIRGSGKNGLFKRIHNVNTVFDQNTGGYTPDAWVGQSESCVNLTFHNCNNFAQDWGTTLTFTNNLFDQTSISEPHLPIDICSNNAYVTK